jgi:hypothetical protein
MGDIQEGTQTTAIDLEALRLPQNYVEMANVERKFYAVKYGKPKQVFFRIKEGEDWRMDVAILELEATQESYLVIGSVVEELFKDIKPKRIYFGVDKQGNPFLWPVSLPKSKKLDSYSESAHRIAEVATKQWTRLVTNTDTRAHQGEHPTRDLGEPSWPDLTFAGAIELAFKDRIISSASHEVVKTLRGEL